MVERVGTPINRRERTLRLAEPVVFPAALCFCVFA
jgi:hypothetical protein